MKFKDLVNVGIHNAPTDQLKRKVQLTNITAIILALGIDIPFTVLSLFVVPPLAWITITGFFICMVTLLLNKWGFYNLSRWLISLLPITLASLYQMGLMTPGQLPVPGIYLVQMAFAFIPFITFDLREPAHLFGSLFITFLFIVSYPATVGWYTVKGNAEFFLQGVFKDILISIGVLLGMSIIYALAYILWKEERKTSDLLDEMDRRNSALVDSEDKMRQQVSELEKARKSEELRQWAAEGEAQLSRVLRSDQSGDDMFDSVLRLLIKYLNCNQGGLYLAKNNEEDSSSEDECLELVACYAWERKKFLHQRVNIGQGLAGQAMLEKLQIYLKEVPDNYISITSGLGEALPTAVIIVPMVNEDDTVEGVIELASFHEFGPEQQNFLKSVSQSLAATVRSHRINENNKVLLKRAQEKEELLRSQEEEMRQNMEELEATQESNERAQAELNLKINELESELEAYKQQFGALTQNA